MTNLTDTDFRRVGVQVIPANSKGAFNISKASFRLARESGHGLTG